MSGGWIGVDLDGTLAHYEEWVAETSIGAPVPKMVQRVKAWLNSGREVRIFTARIYSSGGRDVSHIVAAIQDWTEKHIGVRLPVTNIKDYAMIELWDDRAVGVVPNKGERCDGATDLVEVV